MGRLEAGAEGIRPRVLERGETADSVRLQQRHRDEAEAEGGDEQDDVTQPATTRPVGAGKDADRDDRGA